MLTIQTPDWMDEAACSGMPLEIFFPDESGMGGYSTARQVCAICPVRSECLSDALERGDEHGMWGGLTGPKLKQERRRRERA